MPPMKPVAGGTLITGQTTVTTPGTAVPLGVANNIASVVIKALAANSGNIFVGTSSVTSSNGFQLAPGDSVTLIVGSLTGIYINADAGSQSVSWAAT